MDKQNLNKLQAEQDKLLQKSIRKRKKRMKVSGAGTKELNKIIRNKRPLK